jgi:hypothetical protein
MVAVWYPASRDALKHIVVILRQISALPFKPCTNNSAGLSGSTRLGGGPSAQLPAGSFDGLGVVEPAKAPTGARVVDNK